MLLASKHCAGLAPMVKTLIPLPYILVCHLNMESSNTSTDEETEAPKYGLSDEEPEAPKKRSPMTKSWRHPKNSLNDKELEAPKNSLNDKEPEAPKKPSQ